VQNTRNRNAAGSTGAAEAVVQKRNRQEQRNGRGNEMQRKNENV